MKIVQLHENEYKNKHFIAKYKTNGYYDFIIKDMTFSLQYVPFDQIKEIQFEDSLFNDWLENPVVFGAFEEDSLLGFVEGSYESWNNRYRISNIFVYDAYRGKGIGSKLMDHIISFAQKSSARMVVLETQSCNEQAIAFYKKHGFEIIGFYLYSYSNEDLKNHEVRIEMGKKL